MQKKAIQILLFIVLFFNHQSILLCKNGLDFKTITSNDSLYLFLNQSLFLNDGIEIYRKEYSGKEKNFVKRNEAPIRKVKDPFTAKEILGNDYSWVSRAVESENEHQTLRRLQSSDLTGTLLSALNLNVARILGRLYVDSGFESNSTYMYKIVLVDRQGVPKDSVEKEIRTNEYPVRSPEGVSAELKEESTHIQWEYPKQQNDPTDLGVQFRVYRKKGKEKIFTQLNQKILLREQNKTLVFEDNRVEAGVEHIYYITAVDILGRESEPSLSVYLTPEDITAPAIPKNLTILHKNHKPWLKWDMSLELDISHYQIYRSTGLNQKFQQINNQPISVSTPFYVDLSAKPATQYFYAITVVDQAGNESKRSNAISVVCEDKQPPAPPLNLSHQMKDLSVLLTWQAPESDDILGYYIYRGENLQVFPRIVSKPLDRKAIEFVDKGFQEKGLIPGKSYYFGVTTVDNAYNESEKTIIKVIIPDSEPPLPPSSVQAEIINNEAIQIVWGASLSPDVQKYNLYRSIDGKEMLLTESPQTARQYSDADVTKGNQYTYVVTAVDSANNESIKTTKTVIRFGDAKAPSSPRNVSACLQDGVRLSWGRVVDNDLAGYSVYRSTMATGIFEKLNASLILERDYFDEQGSDSHWYWVKAVDSSGNESQLKRAIQPVRCRE